MSSKSENGGALIYILIAIALFAALAFAFSGSNSVGNTRFISEEEAKLKAMDIAEYSRNIKLAVQMMKVNGVSDDKFCFHTELLDYDSYETSNCLDESNIVFAHNGGGAYFRKADAVWLDEIHSSKDNYGEIIYTGRVSVVEIASDDSDDASQELIMLIPFIKENICNYINDNLGVKYLPVPTDDFEAGLTNSFIQYGVSDVYYSSSIFQSIIGNNSDELSGKKSACVMNNDGQYYYYNVLISR